MMKVVRACDQQERGDAPLPEANEATDRWTNRTFGQGVAFGRLGKVADDLACPACRRQKSETMRWSENKRAWTVAFQSISYRDAEQPGHGKKTTLCLDCGWAATQLGKEAAARLGVEQHEHSIWVELDDVAHIVVPRPHSRHAFRNDHAETIVDVVAARIAAARGWDEDHMDV